jgi:two-component sensor histidine kinase
MKTYSTLLNSSESQALAFAGKKPRTKKITFRLHRSNQNLKNQKIDNVSQKLESVMLELLKKEELVKELHHRTKNSFNLITSLIHLRAGISNSKETNTILDDLFLRVKSISDLYSLLFETHSFSEVKLDAYCIQVIDSMLNLSGNITLNRNIEGITILPTTAAPIGMILVEILSNTIKHAFPGSRKGIINIELKSTDSGIVLKIEDNGIGLPSGFDINKIKSIGLHLVNLLVSQLDGNITIHSENGTKILIEFPI